MAQKLICLWLLDLGDSEIVLKEYISAHITRYGMILPVSLRKRMKHDAKVQVT